MAITLPPSSLERPRIRRTIPRVGTPGGFVLDYDPSGGIRGDQMGDLQQQVVDHYFARVELLALEAESGEFVSSELAGLIGEAVEGFSETGHPGLHYDAFTKQLMDTAESYREASPTFATIFSRASTLVSAAIPS